MTKMRETWRPEERERENYTAKLKKLTSSERMIEKSMHMIQKINLVSLPRDSIFDQRLKLVLKFLHRCAVHNLLRKLVVDLNHTKDRSLHIFWSLVVKNLPDGTSMLNRRIITSENLTSEPRPKLRRPTS